MGAKRHRATPLLDPRVLGWCLRESRIRAGFRDARDFCEHLGSLGIHLSLNQLYRYERGEQLARLDVLVAAFVLCRPPRGLGFYADAFSPPAWDALIDRPEPSRQLPLRRFPATGRPGVPPQGPKRRPSRKRPRRAPGPAQS